ncbi:exostosin domain-containing protein [Nonlabens xiamenensis]|uniref:exostosin domain-containing protein n=1 Tax=Nonlabens xiamenensis TaxID=2341043 RepID=UPI000F60DF7D|nr:exostosin family protein [Nonlabens xiamenensis]
MIKIFTYRDLLTPGNRRRVHPLLFDLHYNENPHPSVQEHFEIEDDAQKADFFIFPIDYSATKEVEIREAFDTIYQESIGLGKKIMVYTGGDYGFTFNDDHIITWRNAGFKSSNDTQTIILPSFIDDPIDREGFVFKIHKYQPEPHIAFTGYANAGWSEQLLFTSSFIKRWLFSKWGHRLKDVSPLYNAAKKRFYFLKDLEQDDRIQTEFIYRDKYRAGVSTLEEREQSTEDFFNNLNAAPYTFCLRGTGNFSVRFYESLACGRIPVLIDTDVHLPLDEEIDWDRHICRVQPEDNVADQLIKYHQSHTSASFEKLQESNRHLYLHYLVRHKYWRYVKQILKSIAES